eukprot:2875045-Amphidinium_carterae.1
MCGNVGSPKSVLNKSERAAGLISFRVLSAMEVWLLVRFKVSVARASSSNAKGWGRLLLHLQVLMGVFVGTLWV